MRGCLFILVLAAAVLGTAAWFGSPALASTVITAALEGAGYHAASSTVSATSDPPPKLLLGRADRVEIVGTDVVFRTFHAAGLDLILTDVDVIGRTAGAISGRISGATLNTGDGATTSADVAIEGPAGGAKASIVVDGATVDTVVKAALRRAFGVTIASTELVAPDVLRLGAAGATIEGRLTIDASGAIALATPLGSAPILSLDPSFPLRLSTIRVEGGDLHVDAILDAEALFGG